MSGGGDGRHRCVLVTSVGSGVGEAIVCALRRAGRYRIVGTNSIPASAGGLLADVTYLVTESRDRERFAADLEWVVAKERPQVILAGRDDDTVELAAVADQVAAAYGVRCLVPRLPCAVACWDKLRTWEVLSGAGVPYARTAVGKDGARALAREVGFPLLRKPRMGNASRGVFVAFSPEELENLLADEAGDVYQEFLVPDSWPAEDPAALRRRCFAHGVLRQEEEYSVQVLTGPNGEELGIFMSCNSLVHGQPIAIVAVQDEGLAEVCRRAAAALRPLGLAGPVNFQARRVRQRGYVLFEVNARFTGITGSRAAMGWNEVDALYRYAIEGETVDHLLEFRPGRRAIRYLTEVVYSERGLEAVRRAGEL